MSSFRVVTSMLGHNARVGRAAYGYNGCKSPKGYKRTDVPTWEQRVEFNNLINDTLDNYKLSCNVVSGNYTVRTKDGGARRSWCEGGDSGTGWSGDAAADIMTEKEAREYLNSDKLEAEHKAATAEARREKARESRQRRKLFENSQKVTLAGFSQYNSDKRTKSDFVNGRKVTHYRFAQILAKLSRWERRQVKAASVAATLRPQLSLVGAAC